MRVAEETCVGSAGASPAASGTPPDAPGVGLRSFAGPVCEGDAFSECGVPGEAPGTAGGAPALPPRAPPFAGCDREHSRDGLCHFLHHRAVTPFR